MDDRQAPRNAEGDGHRLAARSDRAAPAQTVQKDRLARAYAERNALAVAFVKMAVMSGWPAGRSVDHRPKNNWGPDWHHIVCVALPNGELLRWHLSPDDLPLLQGLPCYTGPNDGPTAARRGDWPSLLPAALRSNPIEKGGAAAEFARGASAPRCGATPPPTALNTDIVRRRVKASYWGPRAFRVEEFATFNAALAWLIRNRHTVVKDALIDESNKPIRLYTQTKLNELAVAMDGRRVAPHRAQAAGEPGEAAAVVDDTAP